MEQRKKSNEEFALLYVTDTFWKYMESPSLN
jgi:hypothetical protein